MKTTTKKSPKHKTPKLAVCFSKDTSIPLLVSPESRRLVQQRNWPVIAMLRLGVVIHLLCSPWATMHSIAFDPCVFFFFFLSTFFFLFLFFFNTKHTLTLRVDKSNLWLQLLFILSTSVSLPKRSLFGSKCTAYCYLFPISLCRRKWMLLALSANSGYCSMEST